MPLTTKGKKILGNMVKEYGPEKGKRVFYASINKGSIGGVEGGKKHHHSPVHSHSEEHPGFKAVASKIASRSGVSQERAGAILAASSRKASAAAKKKNPRLRRVKGS